MKSPINFLTNMLLILGSLLLSFDFYLTYRLGSRLGFTTQINGWTKYGLQPLWLDLMIIMTMLISLLVSLTLFNATTKKSRNTIVKIFYISWDRFFLFINPYILIFLDAVIAYKIISMHFV